MPNGLDIEWSHARPRTVVRVEQVTPVKTPETPATHKPKTPGEKKPGRDFAPGNQAWRLGQLKRRAEGIATMNPATVPTWMRPHVELGRPYTVALLGMLEGKPALHPLAGDCSDAHVLYRALLSLALEAADAKTRGALMAEARGWLREHRTALATLSALSGGMRLPEPDAHAALQAIAAEEAKDGD